MQLSKVIMCVTEAFYEQKLPACRKDVALCIARQLLSTCAPSPSDIHSKGRLNSQSRSRDERGINRGERTRATKRDPWNWRRTHSWDTSPFQHLGSLWCDRLLLGDPAVRTALLLASEDEADISIQQVRQQYPHIAPRDIVVVTADGGLDVGAMSLNCDVWNGMGRQTVVSPTPGQVWVLKVGYGRGAAPLGLFSIDEEVRVRNTLAPLASFVASLWTAEPERAASYLASNPSQNTRLWATMQSSMLSYRDEAVLKAHRDDRPVGANMGRHGTRYQAKKILDRLNQQRSSP